MSTSTPPPSTEPVVVPRGDSADWAFARRPFWVFSHFFALAVVVLFVALGFWQLSRHDERQQANAIVSERLAAQPLTVGAVTQLSADAGELDYRPALVSGVFVESDFARVVNRSQGGVAGEHVVGLLRLADGTHVAVNRGFVPANADPELGAVPAGPTVVSGWLRSSVDKGRFGADDSGRGTLIPRMNTDDIADRFGADLPDVWLQVADAGEPGGESSPFPDPVPLPELDAGPHLGYAAQWFVFAILGVLFYGALVRRQSRTATAA